MGLDLITAAGALILAFGMGAIAGVVFTITVLVRHAEREAAKAKPSGSVRDMNREAVSEFLDRPLARFRAGRKVKGR